MIPAAPLLPEWSLAELADHFAVPIERVRWSPIPGTATEADVIAAMRGPRKRLCELIDGTLVEKAMGYREGVLGSRIGRFVGQFVDDNDLGAVAGADGTMRIQPGMVRIPDVSFVSWERLGRRSVPATAVPSVAPEFAVEVLSESNTRREMDRKLKDYFFCGARLVWYVDPETRTVAVYTAPDAGTTLDESGTLDGGDVLPGFTLPVRQIFARLGPRE